MARTNNDSEGWHSKFRHLAAKHHPNIYPACRELKKEQATTEISLVELDLAGKKIESDPKKKWIDAQERIKKFSGGPMSMKIVDE